MHYVLEGLDCAHCAAKIERELNKIEGIGPVSVNFATKSLHLDPAFAPVAQEIIDRIEPGVKLIPFPHKAEVAATGRKGWRENISLYRILAAGLLFLGGLILEKKLAATSYRLGEYGVFLAAYILAGGPVLAAAFRNIGRGQIFDENFLMSFATFGAIAIDQLPEAVGVMLFYAVGEFFQDLAVHRSRRSIAALLDLRPSYANLIVGDSSRRVAPEAVAVGQIIEVRPGERLPLDGEVVSGSSFVDTSALTGEPVPRRVEAGDGVLAGFINGSGLLRIRVTKSYSESSVARILNLVENAAARKAPTEKFITAFAGWYTPLVVFGAVAVALLPPLIIPGATFSQWIYRALILLVISCPCALVVSIPLGYFGGIGGASRSGILVKGANFLDALTHLDTVVFDKTGTLTKGVFKVTEIIPQNGFTAQEVLEWAALAEAYSTHPIARSILEAFGDKVDNGLIEDYQEIRGHGLKVRMKDGRTILAGNGRLLQQEGIVHQQQEQKGTVVYVAVDGVLAGHLVIADELKEGVAETVAALRKLGVKRLIMVTGDNEHTA
ncbi:MAG: heavy metal translocating P-type ATPase, partial [bacterium]